MSDQQKPVVKVPYFDFGGAADVEPQSRSAEIVQTREAFKEAGYMPPDPAENKIPKQNKTGRGKSQTAPISKSKAQSDVPNWRRPRGRPAGERQHRISMKTTEQHLAFMYEIADGRELVGAFERALEALAREVLIDGQYDGRDVSSASLKLAEALHKGGKRV